MKVSDIFVTAVVVVDEYAVHVDERIKQLSKILRTRYSNYEMLIVDNGLAADELKAVIKLLPKVACIRLIRLSRNHDPDTAIFAGVEASIGDYVCLIYDNDPIDLIPDFIEANIESDIVFGVASNLFRKTRLERWGARIFYWYGKRFMDINVPLQSTYFISMNRTAANALTTSGRFMRHIRHMAQRVGFTASTLEYELPPEAQPYSHAKTGTLLSRGIDLVANYSSHPLRMLSYFGIIAGLLNIVYAVYVVIVNLSKRDIAQGWTTLSLQSSLMFFILFMILAVLAEYIGKILNETQQEPPYHIMQELSSTISVADETRRNVTK